VTLVDELVMFAGHQVHLVRSREVPRLLGWLGRDLARARVLDLAGGDGFWGGKLARQGAFVVNLDIARNKLLRGLRLRSSPSQVQGDALRLPFPDASFDAVISVCALEHFDDPRKALAEISRVLSASGRLVMSVDALTRASRYPALFANHSQRYHVQHTFRRESLARDLEAVDLRVVQATYLFRGSNERVYLGVSRLRPDWSWNVLAPLAPITALIDRLQPNAGGAILLVEAAKASSNST
jgi:SAM-dependent methyltransferase